MTQTPSRQVATEMAAIRLGELGWTQQDLADETGMPVESINRFLNGHRWPQVRNRAKISRALWGDPMRLDELAKGQVPAEQIATEVAALRRLLERILLSPENAREAKALLDEAERRRAETERVDTE